MPGALSFALRLKSTKSFRGESSLPVLFAGQTAVHLPHSVHVYESSKVFHVTSSTSFTPKRCGGGASLLCSERLSINFTSRATDSILFSFEYGSSRVKKTFGTDAITWKCLE